MGRPRNKVKTIQLTISTTEMTKVFLETLVENGPYGKNAAEAADRLISAKLIDLMEAGGLLGSRLEAKLAELQAAQDSEDD